MRQVARLIAGELVRRGELVRTVVTGGPRGGEIVYLVRGEDHQVDLHAIFQETPVGPLASAPGVNLTAVAGMLGAMEEAQDLEVGDPLSNVAEVVLDGILGLLERHLPGVRLVLQIEPAETPRGGFGRVVVHSAPAAAPFWLQRRTPGTSLWLPGLVELPPAVRETLGTVEEAVAAAVVPLYEPAEISGDPYAAPREKGQLFLFAPADWSTATVLALAHKVSGFVTRRWRQQWTVNRRIHTDSLTGVHNRAFFDSQFTIELERARRGSFALTLILGDLDWFKRVNDTHGHHCGDLMLQEVARSLQVALRRIDHVCRIGGEEFALILPHTAPEEASDVMSRLLARPFSVVSPLVPRTGLVVVTMSYGVVTYPEGGADAFELYRKADAMLYLSKDRGRNRCHFWRDNDLPAILLPQPSST